MSFYLLLASSTALIFFLQYHIWKKNNNIFLPLATLFLYYWSLLGGWFIVFDALNNNAAAKIGVHYYAYFDKLFPVYLNNDYFKSLCYYSLFIISFQVAQLILIRKRPEETPAEPVEKLGIGHPLLILISLLSVIFSFCLIYPQIAAAYANNESFYLYISRNHGTGYSLSQLLRTCSLLAALGGMVLLLSGDDSKYFSPAKLRFAPVYYTLLIIIVMFYSSILGSRHDLVYTGLFAFILYSINTKKIRPWHYALIILVIALPVFFTELTRGMTLFSAVDQDTAPPRIKVERVDNVFLHALASMVLSNEIFSGHMSMYGAIHYQLPFTYGSSLLALLSSLIPRFLIAHRPMDIYQHYITVAMNPGTQGFTINHAAGWYLNFGAAGVLAGGVIFGMLIAFVVNYYYGTPKRKIFFRLLQVLALPGIISFMPMIIRSGPEGYKALIFEGIIMPVLIFWVSGIHLRSLLHRSAK